MPLKRIFKSVPYDPLPAGYLENDWEALTSCQRECSKRLATTVQIEQEAYLSQHPEVKAMLEVFVSKMVCDNKRKGGFKEAAEYFTRPQHELDMEIKQRLSLPPHSMNYVQPEYAQFHYEDRTLETDIRNIISKHYHTSPPGLSPPSEPTLDTTSSTFISIVTSDTTLPTPEPIPTPDPTFSETMLALVSNTVDKAIFLHVDDVKLRYDTAYVELMKAVEEAMEITVIEIKQDIVDLLYNAYSLFEIAILEKERIAAELAWANRISKKVVRTIRMSKNFKGYETPKPDSEVESDKDDKIVPRPCLCCPQFNYNRYPKDRFGIYLPREEEFCDGNITATPIISEDGSRKSENVTEGKKNDEENKNKENINDGKNKNDEENKNNEEK